MRFLIVLTLIANLALTAPALAEITDLRARVDGDSAQIWIALDDQPAGLVSEVSESGLTLTLLGTRLRARSISPASDTLVAAIVVDPLPDGADVRLFASRSWTDIRAELRQGGVLVTLSVGPAAQVRISADAMAPSAAGRPATSGMSASEYTGVGATRPDAPTADPVVPADAQPTGQTDPDPTPARAPMPASAFSQGADGARTAGNDTNVVPPGVCAEEADAVADSPWDEDRLHAQAACLSGGGHHAAAASIYEQMLAFEPENFRATVALAEIRVTQGDQQAARDLYNQAARHAISDAEAARARSRLRALQDQ